MKLSAEAAHLPHLRPLPESQPSSSPLLQTAPGIKGHQRVVTLAQHISVSAHLWPLPLGEQVDRATPIVRQMLACTGTQSFGDTHPRDQTRVCPTLLQKS